MALKTYKPTTPSQRELVLVDRSHLYKGKPVKGLIEGKHSTGGRNNAGRVTVRWRGGGHKRAYRLIDFKRRKLDMPATVERLEYDPNRTAFIALVKYADGELSYILAPQRLAAGDTIVAAKSADVKPGNAMPLMAMPVGTIVHNIEMKPGAGGQIARSAGTYAQYVGREQGYAILRLNSGEQRLVHQNCYGHGWGGFESRPRQRQYRQSRPQSLEGSHAFGSWRRHEPGRSSARRRRRPHLGRSSPGDAVGQADQGQEDPQ